MSWALIKTAFALASAIASTIMKVLSVNVAEPREILHRGQSVLTGIYKEPVAGRQKIGPLGIAGDKQADLNAHGGVHKAVYCYPFEHYAYWSGELGRSDFPFGQFGENLTTEGLTEDHVCIGDVFRFGSALLEVTQPRVPCFKLAHKMDLLHFPKQFITSLRTGFYFRVLEEGEVCSGDAIERVTTNSNGMSVREMMRIMHIDRDDFEAMERAIRIQSLTPSWREELQERLSNKP